MKRLVILFPMILLFAASVPTCSKHSTDPVSLNNLQHTFVDGLISADLMPSVPPDPIICQLTLLAENASASETLTGLSLPQAVVFLKSTGQKLGTISLSTTWDGRLAPMEQDTVRLSKPASNATIFDPPCNQYVYLDVAIFQLSGSARSLTIDSLQFQCVY